MLAALLLANNSGSRSSVGGGYVWYEPRKKKVLILENGEVSIEETATSVLRKIKIRNQSELEAIAVLIAMGEL